MTFTSDDLTSLGAKLDALDLTGGEREALTAILTTAVGESEVEGFAAPDPSVLISQYSWGTSNPTSGLRPPSRPT